MLNQRAQLDILRKEHQAAIERFDFDHAEEIGTQITRLQQSIKRTQSSGRASSAEAILAEEKEKLNGALAKNRDDFMKEKIAIQQKFHERFQSLQARFTEEKTQLSLQHANAMEKEVGRPIPEAEAMFERSKVLGREQKYQEARYYYQSGTAIKEQVLEQRRAECNQNYDKLMSKLEANQAHERDVLEAKQKAALEELETKQKRVESQISGQMRVKEIKAQHAQAKRPSVRPSGTLKASSRQQSRAGSRTLK